MKKVIVIASAALIGGALLGGCGKENASVGATKDAKEEITQEAIELTVYNQYVQNITDDEFELLIAKPVKAKYPNITMKLVRSSTAGKLEDLVAAGTLPDMVFTEDGGINNYEMLKIVDDLKPLAQSRGLDIGKFDPGAIQNLTSQTTAGQLFAIPFSLITPVLFYNKDIFDKFGAPYPKDNMLWEEAIDLARKVTRQDGGIQYKGLHPQNMQNVSSALALPFVDAGGKAQLVTDGWKRGMEVYSTIMQIEGNKWPADVSDVAAFTVQRDTAMLANYNARIGELDRLQKEGNGINWDMASMPTFKEAPGKNWPVIQHVLMISSTSKHKTEAFRVIELLTDAENQTRVAKRGRVPSLKDPKVKESFGTDLATLKGKNTNVILNVNPANKRAFSPYNKYVSAEIAKVVPLVVNNKLDINSALRQAQDASDLAIKDAKSRGE
ncbi:ABC transporter substrate-binding protein [Paenibacillus hodogayensis]|uniref:ABC transporter substrate-binding protein n=1 Tax=Paenibacillus hodogayensis TaxID=279208 RepID=A0ABV5VW97_9BACL